MHDLITYLANRPDNGSYHGWYIQRINGSANNILYRATNSEIDVAVKFTIHDSRRRARREFNALLALHRVGLTVAPQPILLDETAFPQPVVIQSWMNGSVQTDPPQTDDEWRQLVTHYAVIHTVTPDKVDIPITPAVLNFDSIAAAHKTIRHQLAGIPQRQQPVALRELVSQLSAIFPATAYPKQPATSPTALCRGDSNILNFLRRPNDWGSVDWEYSGWGDPAFEIAELMAHPQYHQVPMSRWQWVVRLYGELSGDEKAVARIHAYYPFMLVWWMARLARMLYEVPRGLDNRLVERRADWQEHIKTTYERYRQLAVSILG